MNKGNIIAISGAPRSGKSFLVQRLAEHLGYEPLPEEEHGIPDFLQDDIKNNTNSLRRVLWFRNMQVLRTLRATQAAQTGNNMLLDTFWLDNHAYIDVLLQSHDNDVAKNNASIDMQCMPWPDVILYLRNSEETTKRFLTQGERTYDAGDFFETTILPLQTQYDKLFAHIPQTTQLIVVNRGMLDFAEKETIEQLVQRIHFTS